MLPTVRNRTEVSTSRPAALSLGVIPEFAGTAFRAFCGRIAVRADATSRPFGPEGVPACSRLFRNGSCWCLAAFLAFALLVVPLAVPTVARAASIEDCDLDGYDDATGSPVPWAGFDSTRGDEIPADWDGVSGSYEKPAGAGYTPPATGSSGSGSGSGSSGSGKSSSSSSSSSSSGKTQTQGSGSSGSSNSSSGQTSSGTGSTSSNAASSAQADPNATSADSATAATATDTGELAATTATTGDTTATATLNPETTATVGATAESAGSGPDSSGGSTEEVNNLWDALTIGFNGKNPGLVAGLSTLASLVVASGATLGVSTLRRQPPVKG
jgi:hypothetical protein